MRKFSLLLLSIAICSVNQLYAQCMMLPVSLKDRCSEATTIIEGKVLEKTSCWNAEHNNIYTRNVIEIYKSFKGDTSLKKIEIITEGGLVDNIMQEVSSSLSLIGGDYGVFMVKPCNIRFPANLVAVGSRFVAVAAGQGFIRFNPGDQSAADIFNTYAHIPESVYQPIEAYTGSTPMIIKKTVTGKGTRGDAIISGFSPGTLTAGTKSILTITGSGFGATRGTNSVAFMNAGYASSYTSAYDKDYISWSDTQIKLYVANFVGTGKVRVIISGTLVPSTSDLTVTYARSNINTTQDSYQSNFIGPDNSGYKWIYNNQFDAIAKPAFARAFSSWRCGTLVNWQLDKVNTTSISKKGIDNVNVITFDFSDPLPTGALGQCSSMFANCGDTWYVEELDIVFNSGVNWNYAASSPGAGQSDFESVALHELGHGHQLGHVRDVNDVMHYAIGDGKYNRVLNHYNLECGDDVMSASTTHTYCANPKIVAISTGICNIGTGPNTGVPGSEVYNNLLKVFPNPSSGTFHIEFDSPLQHADCEIYNLVGQLVFSQKVNPGKAIITLHSPPGIYLVKVKDDAGVWQSKLTVE